MDGAGIAAMVLFGPLALLWLSVMAKASYNIIVHNSIWGEE